MLSETKACDVTKNMFATLAEGGRMNEVFKVIDMYSDLLTMAKGEVKAVVTSAKPLPKKEMDELMQTLKGMLVSTPVQ